MWSGVRARQTSICAGGCDVIMAAPGMQLMSIQCPPGAMAGQQITVNANGQPMQVAVPAGVTQGQTFQIQVPMQQQPPVLMAQPVGQSIQPVQVAGYGGGYGGGYAGGNQVIVTTGRGTKRLSAEGWCWVIILFLVFWPLCWLPFVMDGCYEYS